MKFGIQVLPRPEVLDSQGRAVEELFKKEGFDLQTCRVGRYIEVEIPEVDENKAMQKIQSMSDYVLYNPLIETLKIQKL